MKGRDAVATAEPGWPGGGLGLPPPLGKLEPKSSLARCSTSLASWPHPGLPAAPQVSQPHPCLPDAPLSPGPRAVSRLSPRPTRGCKVSKQVSERAGEGVIGPTCANVGPPARLQPPQSPGPVPRQDLACRAARRLGPVDIKHIMQMPFRVCKAPPREGSESSPADKMFANFAIVRVVTVKPRLA